LSVGGLWSSGVAGVVSVRGGCGVARPSAGASPPLAALPPLAAGPPRRLGGLRWWARPAHSWRRLATLRPPSGGPPRARCRGASPPVRWAKRWAGGRAPCPLLRSVAPCRGRLRSAPGAAAPACPTCTTGFATFGTVSGAWFPLPATAYPPLRRLSWSPVGHDSVPVGHAQCHRTAPATRRRTLCGANVCRRPVAV